MGASTSAIEPTSVPLASAQRSAPAPAVPTASSTLLAAARVDQPSGESGLVFALGVVGTLVVTAAVYLVTRRGD